MQTRTYWIAAATLAEAKVVARAVHDGRAPRMTWHDDEAACQARADECNAMLGARLVKPQEVLVEVRTVDDGRITNVWPVDRIGDAAAVFVIFALIPLVGVASLWERIV